MSKLFRAPGGFVLAGSAFLTFVVHLTLAEDHAGSGDWKAPARAASMKNPVPATAQSLSQGKAVYAKECTSCHGDAGKGNGPEAANLSRKPTDLSDPQVRNESDGEIFWKISEGKKPMPRFAHSLNEDQRWHVVNYLRSLAPQKTQ
jgi:mono/diheme cytochrome c family protein